MWPGGLPRDPKIIKNRSGSVGKPSRALGGKTHFAHHGFLGGPGHQQSHFEVPAGTLKSSKNRSLAKKRGARKRYFIDFSREERFSHFWAQIFIDFW